jgi:hypothetical protein
MFICQGLGEFRAVFRFSMATRRNRPYPGKPSLMSKSCGARQVEPVAAHLPAEPFVKRVIARG